MLLNTTDNPKIAPFSWGSGFPSNTWFLVPIRVSLQTTSWFVQLFCRTHPCDQHTDTQTDHATCNICCNWPHLCYACDAP